MSCSTPEGDRSGADRKRPRVEIERVSVVLNARRRSKRGGQAVAGATLTPGTVLNARRRSKRGGQPPSHAPVFLDVVLNARRRSKRGGRQATARWPRIMSSAQRPKAIEAGRTRGADPCCPAPELCSTPEGDRSGADRLVKAARGSQKNTVLNARRRSKRGGHAREYIAKNKRLFQPVFKDPSVATTRRLNRPRFSHQRQT